MIMVRNVTPDDWAILRDIRLRALRESPDAFGTTYAEALGHEDRVWQARASGGSMFFACLAGRPDEPVGLAGGYLERPGEVHLVSMWVAPEARGRSAGAALVEAVASWAVTVHHADALHLWVTETNKPAVRLYERLGFRPTGARQPLPSNPALSEIAMSRPLTPATP